MSRISAISPCPVVQDEAVLASFPWQRSVNLTNKGFSPCVCSAKPETWFLRACHLTLCQDEVCPFFVVQMCQCTNWFWVGCCEHDGFCFFLFWEYLEPVFLCSPTDGPPSAMAIAVVLGGNSRTYSGNDYHEGLRDGFHVRLFGIISSDALDKVIRAFF